MINQIVLKGDVLGLLITQKLYNFIPTATYFGSYQDGSSCLDPSADLSCRFPIYPTQKDRAVLKMSSYWAPEILFYKMKNKINHYILH